MAWREVCTLPRNWLASIRSKLSGPMEPVPAPDRPRTLAHLADTVLTALGHATEHSKAAQEAPDQEGIDFNLEHVARHLAEAVEHEIKLINVLCAYNPEIKTALDELHVITEADRDPGHALAPTAGPAESEASRAAVRAAYEAARAGYAAGSRWEM